MTTPIRFPPGFEWGVATSAYQIEGAVREDGRGVSIWDTFCRQPGRVARGEHADVACDHYHRYRDDVALMRDLGIQSYRFSIAWPRVQPFGAGAPNAAGLGFYDRLVDALLDAGIRPCATLYHWDLPQALQDLGGWANRDVCERFADYAAVVFERLGDRVKRFITFNEPLIFVLFGHRVGFMAPGIADLAITARATHHVHLAHGLAVQRFRALVHDGEVGITHADTSYEPADDSAGCREAVEAARDFDTRVWHDPLYGRGYPARVLRYYEQRGAPLPIQPGDLSVIAERTDFLGVNLYTRTRVLPDDARGLGYLAAPHTLETTPMGYEKAPDALGDFVRFVSAEYGRPRIYVTENGVCDNTGLHDGRIDDQGRIDLLQGFLAGLAGAVADGSADVRGYYLWSLLDNFEWSFGYDKRFGIVHVDYATQRRTPKASAHWYARVIAAHGVDPGRADAASSARPPARDGG
jgi:beta-glucosidase